MIYGLAAMVGLFVVLWTFRAAQDRRMSRERLSVSQIEVFAGLEEPERSIAETAVELLREELHISFPILLEDRLDKDLGVDGEDINDFVKVLCGRCGRRSPDANVEIRTIGEAVRAVAKSPLTK